jgi:toxin ParE1/3/4
VTKLIDAIEAAFQRLRHFPLVGPARDHAAPSLRVVFQGAYAIYYAPLTDAVLIVRVLHGARDVLALADCGGPA